MGFIQYKNEYSLFAISYKDDLTNSTFIALLVYVDDIILAGNDIQQINMNKSHLQDQFKVRDLGKLKFFLGIEVARNSADIHVSSAEIIEQAGLLACKSYMISIEQKHKLRQGNDEDTSS